MSTRKAPIAKRKDPPVLMRFPKDLLQKVQAAADKNGRSRNTEILYRIQIGLQADAAKSSASAG